MARPTIEGHLALIEQAQDALARASGLAEIIQIRNEAESLRVNARNARLGLEVQNRAALVKFCAERAAGAHLASLRLHGGDRRAGRHNGTLTLAELGINKNQSHRWQTIARLPDDVFFQYVENTVGRGEELSSAELLRIADRLRKAGTLVSGNGLNRLGAPVVKEP